MLNGNEYLVDSLWILFQVKPWNLLLLLMKVGLFFNIIYQERSNGFLYLRMECFVFYLNLLFMNGSTDSAIKTMELQISVLVQ